MIKLHSTFYLQLQEKVPGEIRGAPSTVPHKEEPEIDIEPSPQLKTVCGKASRG